MNFILGICLLSSISKVLSDPLCSLCPDKICTYQRNLVCNCSTGTIKLSGSTDQEYDSVSLGFAVDDTGSMGGVIEAVKSTIQTVVQATAGVFDKIVLGTFNDPYVQNLIVSSSVTALSNFTSNIRAHDGGDCPEMAFSGIRDVVNRATTGSAVFVFTDASVKDNVTEAELRTLLISKEIRLNLIATSDLCGGQGADLLRLVNATGGAVYYTSSIDVQYVMNYIAKYAKYGVRFIRNLPTNWESLKALANGTCQCYPTGIASLVCLRASVTSDNATTAMNNTGSQSGLGRSNWDGHLLLLLLLLLLWATVVSTSSEVVGSWIGV